MFFFLQSSKRSKGSVKRKTDSPETATVSYILRESVFETVFLQHISSAPIAVSINVTFSCVV